MPGGRFHVWLLLALVVFTNSSRVEESTQVVSLRAPEEDDQPNIINITTWGPRDVAVRGRGAVSTVQRFDLGLFVDDFFYSYASLVTGVSVSIAGVVDVLVLEVLPDIIMAGGAFLRSDAAKFIGSAIIGLTPLGAVIDLAKAAQKAYQCVADNTVLRLEAGSTFQTVKGIMRNCIVEIGTLALEVGLLALSIIPQTAAAGTAIRSVRLAKYPAKLALIGGRKVGRQILTLHRRDLAKKLGKKIISDPVGLCEVVVSDNSRCQVPHHP